MATVVTLTNKPDVGAVLIEITGAPVGALTIVRVDDNGTGTVRLAENQVPLGGSLTIFDYECALNGVVNYSVTDGADVVTTASTTTSVDKPFITAAILPHFRQAVTAVIDYSATQDTSSTVHWVVDREDPLVISGPQRFRTGGVDLYADDYAKARALAEVATSGEVMMLRQPDYLGMDMYLVPLSVTVRPFITETLPRRWKVSVDYVEVKSPDGPVRSGTWNFDEIKAIGTFNAIKTLFPTFNDLVAGP